MVTLDLDMKLTRLHFSWSVRVFRKTFQASIAENQKLNISEKFFGRKIFIEYISN